VIDISEGGALAKVDRSLPQGARGTLHFDHVDLPLPFAVVASEDDEAHLKFHLNEAKTSELQSLIERLVRRCAA
jgi:hypothetical protein